MRTCQEILQEVLDSIEGGGRTVTFMDDDIDELKEVLDACAEPKSVDEQRREFKRALHNQKVFKLSSSTIDAAEWAWFSRPAQTAPHDAPYAPGIAEQLERTDWTPEEALRWYAEGKHFDTVNGRTRIIDSGAIASNALKHLSLPYLEMKGDAELSELRTQTAPQPEQGGLVEALEYYANGDHMQLAEPDAWDTCSGEPQNFLHDEAGTASVEDGTIAKAALEAYRAALSAQGGEA